MLLQMWSKSICSLADVHLSTGAWHFVNNICLLLHREGVLHPFCLCNQASKVAWRPVKKLCALLRCFRICVQACTFMFAHGECLNTHRIGMHAYVRIHMHAYVHTSAYFHTHAVINENGSQTFLPQYCMGGSTQGFVNNLIDIRGGRTRLTFSNQVTD